MKTALIVLSTLLTISATIPYIVQIIKRNTKPRVVSWFTWTLLTGIACVASFTDGQVAGGVLLFAATIETLTIVVLGLKYGDRKFERFDIVCQLAAVVGVVLWLAFDSPAVAIIATVVIDLIGCLPTIKHSWQKPYEETWITFLLAGAGSVFTILAAGAWTVTSVAYPVYIVVANLVIATVILASPNHRLAGQPSEIREL